MKFKNYTIFGERHSGTNLLEKVMRSYGLPLTYNIGAGGEPAHFKHWFGHDMDVIRNNKDTLFIGIVRNPYDWIMAMFKKPYHVKKEITKDFESFITKEWSSWHDNFPRGHEYYWKEILRDRNPISGERYENIFQLRAVKNKYLSNLHKLTNNCIRVRYEDLTDDFDTFFSKPMESFGFNKLDKPDYIHKKDNYPMEYDQVKLINDGVIWETEAPFGYGKIELEEEV